RTNLFKSSASPSKGRKSRRSGLCGHLFFSRDFSFFRSRCITCPSDSSSASLSDELLPESSEESDGSGPRPGAETPFLLWFPRGERDLERHAPVFYGAGEGVLPPAAATMLDSPPA